MQLLHIGQYKHVIVSNPKLQDSITPTPRSSLRVDGLTTVDDQRVTGYEGSFVGHQK